MKAIIFDSSTVINLAMNGLLDMLRNLKGIFSGKFLITNSVKYEVVDRPLQIKRFELGALQVQKLIEDKILEMPESLKIDSSLVSERAQEILRKTNSLFSSKGENMAIIHSGEASCLALSQICTEKGIENIIAVDERTTRMLVEKPDNLHKLFERKFHTKIIFTRDLPNLKKIRVIRSSELAYVAWKKNLVSLKNGKVLDALLYATKFKGSAISREEIEEIKSV